MGAKVALAGWEECLVQIDGPPQGWWYVRSIPSSLQHSLGRRWIRRFLAPSLQQAQWLAADVHEQVERLLGLSAGEVQLRGREVRLVARDSARRWCERYLAAALPRPSRPDESELVELLMNGFRSRGLVLEEADFLEAREAFLDQLKQPLPALPAPRRRPNTVAGWVWQRHRLRRVSSATQRAWQRELQRLTGYSEVSLPGAITEGAAWRWRNHVLSSVNLSTARRRLGLIEAFYADACRSALVESNPFAALPPLLASSLPPPPLNPEQLQWLDQQRQRDPIYSLVRLLALRPMEVAGLRPIDWSSVGDQRVLWIRSWRHGQLNHRLQSWQQRCLPLPQSLVPLWNQFSGTGLEPIWKPVDGASPRHQARRWSDRLRRSSFCSASQLRQERCRQWRSQGISEHLLRRIMGGATPVPSELAALTPWLELPASANSSVEREGPMLHCPTEPTLLSVCA